MTFKTISCVLQLIQKCFRRTLLHLFWDVWSLNMCFSLNSFWLLCCLMPRECSGCFLRHPIYSILLDWQIGWSQMRLSNVCGYLLSVYVTEIVKWRSLVCCDHLMLVLETCSTQRLCHAGPNSVRCNKTNSFKASSTLSPFRTFQRLHRPFSTSLSSWSTVKRFSKYVSIDFPAAFVL